MSSNLQVKMHPMVMFSVVDAFERRGKDQDRVIGTLLGNTDKSGTIEITNCFVVRHTRHQNGEVAIDIDQAKELLDLYKKINSSENLVGWFCSGVSEVDELTHLIHDYYQRETPNPVLLTVAPSPEGVISKAYVSQQFGVPEKYNGSMFSPIASLQLAAGYDTEMVGLKACMKASEMQGPSAYDSEVEMILATNQKCTESIDVLLRFIDNIIDSSGKVPVPPNSNEIGRQLMSMVEGLGPFGNDEEQMNTNLKDLLMVIYLANLTKTQVLLNEKLSLL